MDCRQEAEGIARSLKTPPGRDAASRAQADALRARAAELHGILGWPLVGGDDRVEADMDAVAKGELPDFLRRHMALSEQEQARG